MPGKAEPEAPSELIDARIEELTDWRGEVLSRVRRLVKQAVPDVVEEWKWKGVPVWSHHGMICTGETYKNAVKLTFAKGASLEDPAGLFNASLEGNVRRAIDLHEGDEIDEKAFRSLVRAAAALNSSSARPRKESPASSRARPKRAKPKSTAAKATAAKATAAKGGRCATAKTKDGRSAKPKLLAGGNPQIAKADGDAPVQAYITAMPGWKRDVGRHLDALVARTVPDALKAVRWNSPFYGMEDQGWFLSFHCFTNYVKVSFFEGKSLRPLPPVESKDGQTRYLHIHEDDQLDEELVTGWIKQASELPGWVP